MKHTQLTTLIVLIAGLASCTTVNGRKAQIGAGFEAGSDFDASSGTITHVEAEFALNEHVTVAGRLMHYAYQWSEEESYYYGEEEEGSGVGLAAEFRYYPKHAYEAFYLGVGLGIFPITEWESTQNGHVTDRGDEMAFAAYGSMGYAIPIAQNITLTPTLILGSYESDSPESGVYGGIGLRLAFGF